MRQSLKPQVMTQLADRNEFPTLFMNATHVESVPEDDFH